MGYGDGVFVHLHEGAQVTHEMMLNNIIMHFLFQKKSSVFFFMLSKKTLPFRGVLFDFVENACFVFKQKRISLPISSYKNEF